MRRAEHEKGEAVERVQRNVEALKQVSHYFVLPRLVSLGVIFYKKLFQGHEQEVELQKAAHNKEIAKIQQQLVRVTAVVEN